MIFNLFKSKPTLKELIPKGFVDIHSHILPGIDDGAKDVKESIELITEMKKLGFSKIIGTPHIYTGLYDNSEKSIIKSFEKLASLLSVGIEIDYASEYMLESSLIKKAREKKILCIKDNFVLVEMSYISSPNNLYEIIFELVHNNYIPILAHPERYRFLHNKFGEFFKLKKVGCKFQINLLSVTGYYGRDILKVAERLLKEKIIDFVGSDIHNKNHLNNFNKKVLLKNPEIFIKCINKNNEFV